MKYSAGQKVRIKSLDWYNENKDEGGYIWFDNAVFVGGQSLYCGCELTICLATDDSYHVIENDYYWTNDMIEGLVEEPVLSAPNITEGIFIHEKDMKWTTEYLLPDGYIFKDENGNVINATKIVLEKKKKEYPKTYKDCCEVLMGKTDFQDFELVPTKFSTNRSEENSISPEPPHISLINTFYKLLICRDAYWKIAGEEMGLGKPWEPPYGCEPIDTFCLQVYQNRITKVKDNSANHCILAFPTEEMRDAFYENFKEEIENCKELL